MGQSGRRVPGLDLVPEDYAHAGRCVFFLYQGYDVGVQAEVLFRAEGAYILDRTLVDR